MKERFEGNFIVEWIKEGGIKKSTEPLPYHQASAIFEGRKLQVGKGLCEARIFPTDRPKVLDERKRNKRKGSEV